VIAAIKDQGRKYENGINDKCGRLPKSASENKQRQELV